MDYTTLRPSPPPAAVGASHLTYQPPLSSILSHSSYPSTFYPTPNRIPIPIAAAPATNSAAGSTFALYGGYAADPGIGHEATETPSNYYNTVGGTGAAPFRDPPSSHYYSAAAGGSGGGGYGHSLHVKEGDASGAAPFKDPGLGQAYYYNAVGGSHGRGYGHGHGHVLPVREAAELFMDPGKGQAPSSYYYSEMGGSGGRGYGNGLSVAPYSDVGLGQAGAALPYQYNSAAGVVGGGGYARGLVVKEAIRQYGIDPHAHQTQTWSSTGLEPTVLAQPSQIPLLRNNGTTNNMHSRETTCQLPMRVNKVAQPTRCEVCKIKCNNKEVLMIHKLGKKHKKNMLKLQEAITAKPARAQVTVVDKKDEGSSVANKDKVVGEQKKRAAPATVEDLQMKKKRILEGGAAASEIKICTICNVVVNSQQVLEYHLAGLKHAAMVKEQAN